MFLRLDVGIPQTGPNKLLPVVLKQEYDGPAGLVVLIASGADTCFVEDSPPMRMFTCTVTISDVGYRLP